MPWIRIDDHFDEHPKLAKVGPLGWAMWLAGLAYCNRNLTDGFIPWAVASTLVPWEFLDDNGDPAQLYYGRHDFVSEESPVDDAYVVAILIGAGVWDRVPGGYAIHDYADYQPTKAQIMAEREAKAAAGRAGGLATAVARGTARAETGAVAESQPNPKPKPVPVSNGSQTRIPARETEIEATRSKQINDRMQTRRLEWFRETGKWDPEWGEKPVAPA